MPSKGLGYSSYFALDVTTPNDPQVLWEFSHPDLGFSTSEPAIVRIGNANQNGKWFAVFASGPTGPIDPNYRQFLGKSDQTPKAFCRGPENRESGEDYRNRHQQKPLEVLCSMRPLIPKRELPHRPAATVTMYFTLVIRKRIRQRLTWTKGGVLRVITKEDMNPANWSWSYVD